MKNFLYLYGPSGAGKTRLLRMMETMLVEQGLSGDVVRIGAETLVEEMVSGLSTGGIDSFFGKYAEIENLMVDNYWIFSRRPHAERMLMRLFRDRRNSGKLTVVASDLPLVNIGNEIVELFDDAVVIDLGQKTPPDQRIANPTAFTCRELSIVSG